MFAQFRVLFLLTAFVQVIRTAIVNKTLIIDNIYPYATSSKPVVSVNYSFPGPMIDANENDTLVIRVINKLAQPTTVHWHGLFQAGTPDMDGAVGATQCAIPPAGEMTYRFKAYPAGTAWYHGHHLDQYADGLIGPLIIRRAIEPSRDQYDTERILMIADWYNDLARTKLAPWYLSANNTQGIEPTPDAIVVNGKFSQSLFVSTAGSLRIRFRIINAAAFSMYKVSIDGLPLHIIELDQTAVVPYTVSSFKINAAQRVSFYINLSELDAMYLPQGPTVSSSVYIRIEADPGMYPVDINSYVAPYSVQRYPYPTVFNPLFLGILSFDSTNSLPRYSPNHPSSGMHAYDAYEDTNILDARPLNQPNNSVPNATHYLNVAITFRPDSSRKIRGYMNNITFGGDSSNMTAKSNLTSNTTSSKTTPLLHLMATQPRSLGISSPVMKDGIPLPVIQGDSNGNYLVPYRAVVDILIENRDDGEHPFHLHGYNFWIISTSDYPQAEQLYNGSYLQRDVVSVPGGGWAKIRFEANNPGAWLFHCHIEWHMDAGLILAFLVAPDQLLSQGYTISSAQKRLCQGSSTESDS